MQVGAWPEQAQVVLDRPPPPDVDDDRSFREFPVVEVAQQEITLLGPTSFQRRADPRPIEELTHDRRSVDVDRKIGIDRQRRKFAAQLVRIETERRDQSDDRLHGILTRDPLDRCLVERADGRAERRTPGHLEMDRPGPFRVAQDWRNPTVHVSQERTLPTEVVDDRDVAFDRCIDRRRHETHGDHRHRRPRRASPSDLQRVPVAVGARHQHRLGLPTDQLGNSVEPPARQRTRSGIRGTRRLDECRADPCDQCAVDIGRAIVTDVQVVVRLDSRSLVYERE